MGLPLIIGIGNEFRGDDAAGILISRKLKNDFPNLEIIEFFEIELDLIDYFKKHDSIVLIDALKSDKDKSGKIEFFEINNDFEFSNLKYFSSHSISLTEILNIAKILNYLPEKLIIIGIHSSNFEIGSKISFNLEETYQLVKKEIEKVIS